MAGIVLKTSHVLTHVIFKTPIKAWLSTVFYHAKKKSNHLVKAVMMVC